MASYRRKSGHQRLERFIDSWVTNAPGEAEFGDVPLTEIRADLEASRAKMSEISRAEEMVRRLKIEHQELIKESMKKCKYIVNDVEGDRRFGPDSPLYAGFGYVRESDKRKGRRKKKTAPAD